MGCIGKVCFAAKQDDFAHREFVFTSSCSTQSNVFAAEVDKSQVITRRISINVFKAIREEADPGLFGEVGVFFGDGWMRGRCRNPVGDVDFSFARHPR